MASPKQTYEWDQEKFDDALKLVCALYSVEEIKPDQKLALTAYFKERKNVYYSAPTGHGKSLVFQTIPMIYDHMIDTAFGCSILLAICPLTSLMQDQVNYLNKNTCASAVSIYKGQDEKILQEVEDGVYNLIYTSPESMLSASRWRKLLTGTTFADNCVGVAVDEAHCIRHWSFF